MLIVFELLEELVPCFLPESVHKYGKKLDYHKALRNNWKLEILLKIVARIPRSIVEGGKVDLTLVLSLP
jgi:hypothetical protein